MKRETFKFKAVLPLTSFVVALGTLASAATDADRDARFEQLDSNGDGKIEQSEMTAERDARFARADTDGDGYLTADEIEVQAAEHVKKRSAEMIERRDTDGDGRISLSEMQSSPRAERRFDRLDQNGDGTIDKAEFDAAADRMKKRRKAVE